MRVRIDVTELDIKNGKPMDAFLCPVALACKRVFADYRPAVASDGVIGVIGEVGDLVDVLTPRRVKRFVEAFDNCREVKPFSFTVNAPASVVKKPAKRKAKV